MRKMRNLVFLFHDQQDCTMFCLSWLKRGLSRRGRTCGRAPAREAELISDNHFTSNTNAETLGLPCTYFVSASMAQHKMNKQTCTTARQKKRGTGLSDLHREYTMHRR